LGKKTPVCAPEKTDRRGKGRNAAYGREKRGGKKTLISGKKGGWKKKLAHNGKTSNPRVQEGGQFSRPPYREREGKDQSAGGGGARPGRKKLSERRGLKKCVEKDNGWRALFTRPA